jgi:hypothetical protein
MINGVVRKVDILQRQQPLTMLQNHIENGLVDQIIRCIDISYTLQILGHSLKATRCQLIVTYFQSSDFMNPSCSMHVLDDLVT